MQTCELGKSPFRSVERRKTPIKLGVVLCVGLLGLAGCTIKPTPIDQSTRLERIEGDIAQMYADQEPVVGSIDLYEAMARGIKYNLDKRLKSMESELAERRLGFVRYDMLPSLTANGGYRSRNNFRGSNSQSLVTGAESLEVSTSEEKNIFSADLRLAWNVLDFGVSYLRAKQEADQVMIARERRWKVAQNVMMDVRDSFWRAVSAELLLPEVDRLIANVESALTRSGASVTARLAAPLRALTYQRALLARLQELTDVRRRLSLAKTELAALINIRPGRNFQLLAPPDFGQFPSLQMDLDTETLERRALLDRPELREEDYRKRISRLEVRRAMLSMLPGLELSYGGYYDGNDFLANNDWRQFSAVISKNLVDLVSGPAEIRFAKAASTVADGRRMALSMAVIAQVHIALQRYSLATETLQLASRVSAVDDRIDQITQSQARAKANSEFETIRASTDRMVSKLRYYSAYADLQNAHGRILNTIGAQRFPIEAEMQDVTGLAATIRQSMTDWQKYEGNLGLTDPLAPVSGISSPDGPVTYSTAAAEE